VTIFPTDDQKIGFATTEILTDSLIVIFVQPNLFCNKGWIGLTLTDATSSIVKPITDGLGLGVFPDREDEPGAWEGLIQIAVQHVPRCILEGHVPAGNRQYIFQDLLMQQRCFYIIIEFLVDGIYFATGANQLLQFGIVSRNRLYTKDFETNT